MYTERPPEPALADRIACLWHQVCEADGTHLVVPDGCVDLIWGPDGPHVAGPDTGPMPTRMRAGDTYTGIRFKPGATGLVFGVPLTELRDQRIPATALAALTTPLLTDPAALEPLTSALAEPPDPLALPFTALPAPLAALAATSPDGHAAPGFPSPDGHAVLGVASPDGSAAVGAASPGGLVAPGVSALAVSAWTPPGSAALAAEGPRGGPAALLGVPRLPGLDAVGAARLLAMKAAVLARLRDTPPSDPAAPAIAAALRAGRTVAEVAWDLGYSERQLHRRTLAGFGYAPKTLQRIVRFQRALRLARSGVPLAEVAASSGYTDQAHLSHDVKRLSGVSMTHLAA
ncbi:DUF6597 domain-containing transcriptional factor [Nonomuraea sediminis]|uniref:DUF6597 domain-containing transcriptional factor n=1 Tax=Nonomuraea sediminis TaxID=2835864 RepID=UPI0027E06FA3|nr:DUF6597 domain-containing transcriptional factor [Nonomuraea sediminis]